MNPNDIQIGGDHYKKAGEHQHWDLMYRCGFGWEYYVGRATAYFARVKNPNEDPAKGVHFIDKLLHLIDGGNVPASFRTTTGLRDCDGGSVPYSKRLAVEDYLNTHFYPANGIDPKSDTATTILLLMTATSRDDIVNARAYAVRMLPRDTTPVEDAAQSRQNLQVAATDEGAPTGSGYVEQDRATDVAGEPIGLDPNMTVTGAVVMDNPGPELITGADATKEAE